MPVKSLIGIEPVLSSSDITRDVAWLEKYTGFKYAFGNDMYAGVRREDQTIHLQWHKGDKTDPLTASTIKIFVHELAPLASEFIERGTITKEKVQYNSPWGTHEFGFYDLNHNAIFIVQDL